MKLVTNNLCRGDFQIEIVAETKAETTILENMFKNGKMTRGNGRSTTESGFNTGFYLTLPIKESENGNA